MNARYPVSTTGPWAQVKHHQVLAAFGAAILVTAVVGAALAWNASDSSSGSGSATTGSAGTFDRIEYMSGSGSSFAPDLNTGSSEIEGLKAGTSVADVVIVSPGGDSVFDLNAGLSDIQELKATRSVADVVIVSPGGDGIFDLYAGLSEADAIAQAIAQHSAAFPALDSSDSGPAYPASREGMRGHVTVE